jgi:hypothetical protein
MALLTGKNSLLKQSISAAYVTVAQLTEWSLSGSKDVTVDSTSLETSAFMTKTHTGYAEPGQLSFKGFYDPGLSGHQSLTDIIGTGSSPGFQIAYSNGTSTQNMTTAGVGVDITGSVGSLLTMSGTIELTGNPNFVS